MVPGIVSPTENESGRASNRIATIDRIESMSDATSSGVRRGSV